MTDMIISSTLLIIDWCMTQPNLNRQLQAMLNAMINSANLLYNTHSLQFKLGALTLLAYIAYRMGRSTVTDPLDNDVKNINRVLKNRQHYTVHIPQKIKTLGKSRQVLMAIILILSTTIAALYYLQHDLYTQRSQLAKYAIASVIAVLFISFLSIWIYQVTLAFIAKRGGFNDHLIHQKLMGILNALGKKTELLLKGTLCKQMYISKRNQKPLSTSCVKDKCKEYRRLLKQRAEDISRLVENVLNFEWCSVCKKKVPFDELLSFQSRIYHKNQQSIEQNEANERNQYLLSQLQRMQRWAQDASPCNCSKRYWLQSAKQIREFKKQQKIVSQQLAQFQQQSQNSK